MAADGHFSLSLKMSYSPPHKGPWLASAMAGSIIKKIMQKEIIKNKSVRK